MGSLRKLRHWRRGVPTLTVRPAGLQGSVCFGFRVRGLGLRVEDLGLMGLGFRVLGFMGLGLRAEGSVGVLRFV